MITAVDDHSRCCVIAKVVERATARAVCLALAEAQVLSACAAKNATTADMQ
uniref:hypothetical protein n=1 Tax=Paractinoplanes polyasparticus TaxID=2856853 RepID=UPI001C86573A|nr:hypothetical protein [Actinoplanes polyasparticus]